MSSAKSTARDMTSGSILGQIVLFSVPLMLGNVFQMLYNTVDSIVVGNFVSKQALAAVGSTTTIVNIMVFFFNGFSVGAGVVIGHHFGAKELEKLHTAIETTVAITFVLCAFFTVGGVLGVRPMLRFMSTPPDVFDDATTYLTIYFAGSAGLLIYNIGSGILRAVGDSIRPLMFLSLTSILNIILDLVFVIVFHLGIAGVGYATILAQFISAILTLLLLTGTRDIYRLVWKDLRIDLATAGQIFAVGMPAGIQSMITSFSNVFVQSYINKFGSSVMAGWSCYNKLDQFIMLPMHSMAHACTTFVSQNIGARNERRAHRGTWTTIFFTISVTGVIAVCLFVFAAPATGLFTKDTSVIEYGVLFMRTNVFFMLFNCVNHTLAGGLRGRGDARGPMVIMLSNFVVLRQVYLFVATHYFINTPRVVGFGYPVGWVACCIVEVTYYMVRWGRKIPKESPSGAQSS
ncbi:MAG: MATE family efflux transporter [Eubacteriales bacterium]|nr:MATE family efflux transporter [Eubacteriales bacterium]